MNRVFRVCRVSALAAVAGVALAPVSLAALAQTSQSLTCVASSVSVAPISGTSNLSVACMSPDKTTPPPGCSLSASPSVLSSSGGGVTVTASSCASPLTWSRSPGPISTSATGTALTGGTVLNDSLVTNSTTANVTYTYSVTDSLAATATAPAVVPFSSATSGGTSCGTPVALTWGSGYTRKAITVTGSTPVVAQFTVATATTFNSLSKIALSNSGGSAKYTWALASSPCSFPNGTDPAIGGIGAKTSQGGLEYFTIGGTVNSVAATLQFGGTYYFSIKNASGSGSNTVFLDLYN